MVRSDLIDLAALGYRMEVDTALVCRIMWNKRPEQLNETECRMTTTYLLERMYQRG